MKKKLVVHLLNEKITYLERRARRCRKRDTCEEPEHVRFRERADAFQIAAKQLKNVRELIE